MPEGEVLFGASASTSAHNLAEAFLFHGLLHVRVCQVFNWQRSHGEKHHSAAATLVEVVEV